MRDIAEKLGVSIKTVSGALNGSAVRMSAETRSRILTLADELGYKPNIVARGMRQGVLPVVGLVAEGLITLPFATEIVRSLDNACRMHGLLVVATNVGATRSAADGVADAQRFLPTAIVYATSYHRVVTLDETVRQSVRLFLNCSETSGKVPAIVPDEQQAGAEIVAHCFARGRRRIAFLNLPGLVAGTLREAGFRNAHAAHGVAVTEDWLLPATRGARYTEYAVSLVRQHVDALVSALPRPDTILCGNDRVALEVYGALRANGVRIPDDIAVVSFDNQTDIARRLDPPLTTMALPHREIGRRAAEVITGTGPALQPLQRIPFRLIERDSV
ncbi:MAG: LacI family DNA-binding transcriptional regulator [Amaricoccus sp.]|uniref:LacI family DNA-binding transcriptional regulator n=1 Tax=Amaricoccus sp. TaxID=1872485 RepID=UPI0039E302ED